MKIKLCILTSVFFTSFLFAGGGGGGPCYLYEIQRKECQSNQSKVLITKEGYKAAANATEDVINQCRQMPEFHRISADLYRDFQDSYNKRSILVSGYTGNIRWEANGLPYLQNEKLIGANDYAFITVSDFHFKQADKAVISAKVGIVKEYPGAYDAKDYDVVDVDLDLNCANNSR